MKEEHARTQRDDLKYVGRFARKTYFRLRASSKSLGVFSSEIEVGMDKYEKFLEIYTETVLGFFRVLF